MNNSLEQKIKQHKAKLGIIGLGYVGLPLAIEFSQKGFQTVGIDINQEKIKFINRGSSYINDIKSDQLRPLVKNKRLRATMRYQVLKVCDVIIICVPTPLSKTKQPDTSYIINAVSEIAKYIKAGTLVVLESTSYPGTTEELILPQLEKKNLKVGRDFYLAFSPERIDPANAKYPLRKIPKVIGGIDNDATQLGALVYKNIVTKVVPVSSSRVAETVKLLENTFRLINIGMIDELAMMCHKMGIDIWEVIDAAKTKPFGFMPFYPGGGVGGHFIGKHPFSLYLKT